MKIIQVMWIMFQVICKQQNNILHNEVKGVNVKLIDARRRLIYTYKTYYFFPAGLELFSVYKLDDAIEIPPYTKQQWIDILELAVRYCHKYLYFPNNIPSQCIETYFSPTNTSQ